MDGQVWRAWDMGHVETEPRGWVGAFNTSISLGSVYERLLNWEGRHYLRYFLIYNFKIPDACIAVDILFRFGSLYHRR